MPRYRRIARFLVPILGRANHFYKSEVQVQDLVKKAEPFSVRKPGRSLGAPWMDNFVARGKNVVLCETCRRRYGNWWSRFNYRGDWVGWLSYCDGCSRHVFCNQFYPSDHIGEVLEKRFWHDDYKDQQKYYQRA